MFNKVKTKFVSWLIGRSLKNLLVKADVEDQQRQRTIQTVKTTVTNMLNGKRSMKNEPVITGGIITIVVALFAAFGLNDVDAESVAITISTVVAITSFVIRMFVTPTNKEK